MIIWLAALAAASTPPISSSVYNGDFSHGIAGWEVDRSAADEHLRFFVSRGHARLHAPSASPHGSMAIAIHKVDANRLRDRTVELTARIRLRAGAAGVRFAAVHGEPPRRLVRVISPAGSLRPDGKWHVVRVHGRVAADADYLNVGLYSMGASDADFDDVRLERYTPPNRRMSAHASRVLTKALNKIDELHINARDNKVWLEMAARARRDAAGAQTTADLAPAITALLGDLNEHHASLWTPEDQQSSTARQSIASYHPSVRLVDGRFGYVTLPPVDLSREEDLERAKSYIRTVRTGLETLDAKPMCGWIVDLRGNTGGTTFVMASAVAGLALFDTGDWPDEYNDELKSMPLYGWLATETHHQLRQGGKAVAVLIDHHTGSAGEDIALRFTGRSPTRSFGSPTAGFTSSNEAVELADGYTLLIPAGYMHDRKGNSAKDRVIPDEQTDDPIGAAQKWLSSQCK